MFLYFYPTPLIMKIKTEHTNHVLKLISESEYLQSTQIEGYPRNYVEHIFIYIKEEQPLFIVFTYISYGTIAKVNKGQEQNIAQFLEDGGFKNKVEINIPIPTPTKPMPREARMEVWQIVSVIISVIGLFLFLKKC